MQEVEAKEVDAEILSISSFCPSLPERPNPYVDRDNIIELIKEMFQGDVASVFIEGNGKTTLLRRFVHLNLPSTFCIFIRPFSRQDSDAEVIKNDIYRQAYWALHAQPPQATDQVTPIVLRNLFLELSKESRRRKIVYYFIVDGFDQVPNSEFVSESLFGVIPLGTQGIKFLFSGSIEKYPAQIKALPNKSHTLSKFSKMETETYLKGVVESGLEIAEIHKTLQGDQKKLASVRRILLGNKALDGSVPGLPKAMNGLLEIEWRLVESSSEAIKRCIGTIAFDQMSHNCESLSVLHRISQDELSRFFTEANFLVRSLVDGSLSFVSETFRKFACERLSSIKTIIDEALILSLQADVSSEKSLKTLPQYFQNAGRHREVIGFLSAERVGQIASLHGSCGPVHEQIAIGLKSAIEEKSDVSVIMFSTQKSLVGQLNRSETYRVEIEARLALGEIDYAIALANSAPLKEDCLHLLAIALKELRIAGKDIEQSLIERVKQLCIGVDFKSLGDRSIEIVKDLIYASPKLAAELVSKLGHEQNSRYIDIDLAMISMSLASDKRIDSTKRLSWVSEFQERMVDETAKKLSSTTNAVFGIYTSERLIEECESLNKMNDKVFLLRRWCNTNGKSKDYAKISEYAIDIIVKTTDFSPNATIFRELSFPLVHCASDEDRNKLLKRFDAQKGPVEKIGPSEDFVKFQLNLFAAEMNSDFSAAKSRLFDTYTYISLIKNQKSRANSYAKFLSTINKYDASDLIEKSEGYRRVIFPELDIVLKSILESTAEHFVATRNVLSALSQGFYAKAYQLATSLNTRERQDQALNEICRSHSRGKLSSIDFPILHRCVNEIEDPEIRGDAVSEIIRNFWLKADSTCSAISGISVMCARAFEIRDSEVRSRGYSMGLEILGKIGIHRGHSEYETFSAGLENSWNSIDGEWRKAQVAYKICRTFAKSDPALSRVYLQRAEQIKQSISMEGGETAIGFVSCVRLAIRSFSALMRRKLDSSQDADRLANEIFKIPSAMTRIGMLADIAIYYFINKRTVEGTTFVNEKVKPLLKIISAEDCVRFSNAIIRSSAALYLCHKNSCFAELDKLYKVERDDALRSIVDFIFRKCLPTDPFDDSGNHKYVITYEDALDVVEIIKRISEDMSAYIYLKMLCDSMDRKVHPFSGQQRGDIGHKLKEIAASKFPSFGYIQHDGYKILANAALLKLGKASLADFSKLIEDAKQIRNLADRSFVICLVCDEIPEKLGADAIKTAALAEACKLIAEIPTDSDRVMHYETFCESIRELNPVLFKESIQKAMNETVVSQEQNIESYQKNFIDLAYQSDPELAAKLASMIDDDPARARSAYFTKGRLEILRAKDALKKVDDNSDSLPSPEQFSQTFPQACWRAIGGLHAGRMPKLHMEKIRPYIKMASDLAMEFSYPIFSWAIENASKKYSDTDNAKIFLRPMYDALLQTADLAARLSQRAFDNVRKSHKEFRDVSGTSQIIRENDRDEAVEYIRKWTTETKTELITICDPYFTPDDFDIIRILRETHPSARIEILTSLKAQNREITKQNRSHATFYSDAWWGTGAELNPGIIKVVIISVEPEGSSPIHDRWLVSDNAGITFGTSIGSMGEKKISEMKIIENSESSAKRLIINEYISCNKWDHGDKPIAYDVFTIRKAK